MKLVYTLISILLLTSCASQRAVDRTAVATALNAWHAAAAQADFEAYFNLMTDDAIFIGTDATENWTVQEFKKYAKPYFDAGKAWSFTSIERNIFKRHITVFFDELLNTQMGICRGSGVMVREDGQWKIRHYVLSIAVPNENVSTLTQLKKEWDKDYIDRLTENKE